MNTKSQLNAWSLTKVISNWIAIAAILLCASVLVSMLAGKENRAGELLVPILLALFSLVLRSRSMKRMTQIRTVHSM